MKLYGYFRSSATYRLRIAFNLKGLQPDLVAVDLLDREQRGDAYLQLNPQGLVPALMTDDGDVLAQSTAILEWLEEAYPDTPLYPRDSLLRARCRSFCQHIACDIHPLNNLRVLNYLRDELQQPADRVSDWYAHWIHTGFSALEKQVQNEEDTFCFGDHPSMFEVFLIPQVANARRFNVSLDDFPTLLRWDENARSLPAFQAAHPDQQPDSR